MTNKEIVAPIRLAAALLELHEANQFKVRGYQSAVFNLEKTDKVVATLSEEELQKIDGVSKNMATKILDILAQGSFPELDELIDQTPRGVIEMMDVKGIGPKKIRTLWKEMEITDPKKLLKACQNNEISKVKGFGAKTQENIEKDLLFKQEQTGKFLYAEVAPLADELLVQLNKELPQAILTGQFVRKLEIVDTLSFLVPDVSFEEVEKALGTIPGIYYLMEASGPFSWRGELADYGLKIEIIITTSERLVSHNILLTSGGDHLNLSGPEGTLYKVFGKNNFSSSKEAYAAVNFHEIPPEAREGQIEAKFALDKTPPALLEESDIKGSIHNHSTYSDGKTTLAEMAAYAQEIGYEYLGISDHSVSAFYANGLDEDRIHEQHREINKLNKANSDFTVFKGIESDILNDGSLDYPDEILKEFDFIVASVHSNLNMDAPKANTRLIKAIENPHTTFLGHPTGRLLLKREGYPIDHKRIIDACADNGVIIEINSNPRRLDIDWRHIDYALEKGVKLSINPDAHIREGYHDTKYGVLVGRKGGLTAEMTFNTLGRKEVGDYFAARKK